MESDPEACEGVDCPIACSWVECPAVKTCSALLDIVKENPVDAPVSLTNSPRYINSSLDHFSNGLSTSAINFNNCQTTTYTSTPCTGYIFWIWAAPDADMESSMSRTLSLIGVSNTSSCTMALLAAGHESSVAALVPKETSATSLQPWRSTVTATAKPPPGILPPFPLSTAVPSSGPSASSPGLLNSPAQLSRPPHSVPSQVVDPSQRADHDTSAAGSSVALPSPQPQSISTVLIRPTLSISTFTAGGSTISFTKSASTSDAEKHGFPSELRSTVTSESSPVTNDGVIYSQTQSSGRASLVNGATELPSTGTKPFDSAKGTPLILGSQGLYPGGPGVTADDIAQSFPVAASRSILVNGASSLQVEALPSATELRQEPITIALQSLYPSGPAATASSIVYSLIATESRITTVVRVSWSTPAITPTITSTTGEVLVIDSHAFLTSGLVIMTSDKMSSLEASGEMVVVGGTTTHIASPASTPGLESLGFPTPSVSEKNGPSSAAIGSSTASLSAEGKGSRFLPCWLPWMQGVLALAVASVC